MDLKQISAEIARAAHQRLTTDPDFDDFILQLLWKRSPLAVREVIHGSRRWFAKKQIFPSWEVPILMISYTGNALLANPAKHDALHALAEDLKALVRVDYLQVSGRDLCLNYWFDISQGVWIGQSVSLPSDWEA